LRKVFGVLSVIFLGLASAAQAQSLRALESREDGRRWEAVGRLEIAGTAFCTGALITPELVLTAAHCLFDPATGARVHVDDIQFLAGWRNGRAAAYRRVRQAVPHPDYDYSGPADMMRVRHDLALVRLQHPIRNTTIAPFGTDIDPRKGQNVGVVSYAHDRSEAPSLQELCEVVARQNGTLILSCEVDFGASGSPVFTFDASGAPRIVSVVSAKAEAEGQRVSLATVLQDRLDELHSALEAEQGLPPGVATHRAGARNTQAGKFIKP
jgi:V8-like Glu-specific endopeptidase